MAKVAPDKAVIAAGDSNENENGRAIRWLIDQGFTDALSMYDKDSPTWHWDVASLIILQDRFDYIMFNKYLECTDAAVGDVKASDHMPVLAVFKAKRK